MRVAKYRSLDRDATSRKPRPLRIMRAISMRIDPGVRPAIFAALYLTISELGLYQAAAIFGAFPTYVARFIIMTGACFAAFAYLRQRPRLCET